MQTRVTFSDREPVIYTDATFQLTAEGALAVTKEDGSGEIYLPESWIRIDNVSAAKQSPRDQRGVDTV